MAVSLSLASERGGIPIEYQLYLPKDWATDTERRESCGAPENIVFATKPEIALEQMRRAIAAGVRMGVVLTDAGYGDETAFRDGITELGMLYAAGIRPAHRDYLGTEMRPEEWLLVEWPESEPEPTKYFLSTAPEWATLEQLVFVTKMRWRIERDYQELKQDFGLSHYEGRSWRGFHHHATLSIAAYGFLMAQRLKAGRDDCGKKNFAERQAPAVSKDYLPLGSPARAASRAGLDHDATPAIKRRTRARTGALPLLQLDKPKTKLVTQ